MKKSLVKLTSSFIALGLFAASLAGATSFTVNGTNNVGAYKAYSLELSDPTSDPDPGYAYPVAVTSPAGPWVDGSWISYNNPDQSWPMSAESGNLPGTYYYFTHFSLTGLDPATAVIKGSWAADNGSKLYLNIANDPASLIGTSSGYESLTNFVIDSGLLSDDNFLFFIVTNDPYGAYPGINPTGLLVNIAEATANPVPEPSTLLLLGGGLIGVCLIRRRAKN